MNTLNVLNNTLKAPRFIFAIEAQASKMISKSSDASKLIKKNTIAYVSFYNFQRLLHLKYSDVIEMCNYEDKRKEKQTM